MEDTNSDKLKLSFLERFKVKLIINKSKNKLGKTKEELQKGTIDEKNKQEIITALLEMSKIFEITLPYEVRIENQSFKEDTPINEYILQHTPFEEIVETFEMTITELEKIV